MGAVNVPRLFAANAAASALATDALKATDTFPPSVITAAPAPRINVDACSRLSRLRLGLWNAEDMQPAAQELGFFQVIYQSGVKMASRHTRRRQVKT